MARGNMRHCDFTAATEDKEDSLIHQTRKATADFIKMLRKMGVPNGTIRVLAIEHHAIQAMNMIKQFLIKGLQ